MLSAATFFALEDLSFRELLSGQSRVWDALKDLKTYMQSQRYPAWGSAIPYGVPLPAPLIVVEGEAFPAEGAEIHLGDATKGQIQVSRGAEILEGASVIMAGVVLCDSQILLGKGVLVESGAFLKGPLVVGDHTEIRHGAYLRGNCLVGKRCVVGHVTEVKHTIFLDDAKAGHFAYLGDSILGNRVNLGAGTKLANLRFLKDEVAIRTPTGLINTGLKKLGAIMGDNAQTGCNAVTNPGTILGRGSMLHPNTTAPSGLHPNHAVIRR